MKQRFRLSDVVVKQAKCADKKTKVYPDGDGLRFLVYANGIKVWQYRDYTGGKNTTIQLGHYPTMSLGDARKTAAATREAIREGRNPVIEKRVEKAKRKVSSETSFHAVAEELLAAKAKSVSPAYQKKLTNTFNANLYSSIGNLPIQEVTALILRDALRPIEKREALDMLAFTRRIAGEVFEFAKATGRFVGDNPAFALRRNIFKQHQGERMAALGWKDMPEFLRQLDDMRGQFPTIAAVRLLILTGARPGEVTRAKWSEFDLDRALWTLPIERMKKRRMHIVPLAQQAVDLLRALHPITGHHDYLFPSQRQKHTQSKTLSVEGLIDAVRRHVPEDVRVTSHGFRAVFRTHAELSELWPEKVMECALAHVEKNVTKAAYARATHLATRVKLAQWYADELDTVKKGNIVPFRKGDVA